MTGEDITPFAFEDNLVRVIGQNGEPWFIAKDVCRVLELKNVSDAVAKLDADERGSIANPDVTPAGGNPKITIVSEPGLYALIQRSRKPAAKRFDRWVRHEVLPSIRKTGSYSAGRDDVVVDRAAGPVEVTEADMLKVKMVTEARLTFSPRVAGELWFRLCLPVTPGMTPGWHQPSLLDLLPVPAANAAE